MVQSVAGQSPRNLLSRSDGILTAQEAFMSKVFCKGRAIYVNPRHLVSRGDVTVLPAGQPFLQLGCHYTWDDSIAAFDLVVVGET
jgi:hypothetical protein